MIKIHIFIVATILVLAGIVAAVVLHPKQQAGYCINNLRPLDIDVATRRSLEMRDAYILSIVPPGTPFSNAVAVLGSHYTVWKTPSKELLVRFPVIVPGVTNRLYVNFEVTTNNCVVEHMGKNWIGNAR